ncbi:TlpA family protein disulfide reductase [Streptococcus hillyeri]|nr:TlpA disulfide reductase family protein [Streptococcus hillyeri]
MLIVVVGGVVLTIRSQLGLESAGKQESQLVDKGLEKEPLPEFVITDSSGKEVNSSSFIGKPTVIMEWASWCPDCQAALPFMNELYDEYKDEVAFVFINATGTANGEETQEVASAYIEKEGYSFPYYYDVTLDAATKLGVEAIPTYLFVNAEGTIQKIASSEADKSTVESSLQELLQ